MYVEQNSKDEIFSIIRSFKFNLNETKDLTSSCAIRNKSVFITCNKDFQTEEMGEALNLYQILRQKHDKITDLTPMFLPSKSKKPIILTMLFSGVVTFGTVLGAVHYVSPTLSWGEALFTSGIPAIITPLIQIGYRYFRVT